MKLSWRAHIVFALLALLQLGSWFATRSSRTDLAERWEFGSPTERLAAGHVLLNRGPAAGGSLGAGIGKRLLGEEDTRLRSLAFTSDACKLAPPRAQMEAILDGLERGSPAAFRDFVLQFRKVGGASVGASAAMGRRELEWFQEARHLDSWPPEELERIQAHLAPLVATVRAYLNRD